MEEPAAATNEMVFGLPAAVNWHAVLIGDRIGSQLIDGDRQLWTALVHGDRVVAVMSCRSDLGPSGGIAAYDRARRSR